MKWSFSNIAWEAQYDERMYHQLSDAGFTGLEIAPTRIIPSAPYKKQKEIREWSKDLYDSFGLRVSSMQSIWYGRTENLFADISQREALLSYTKEAILFAKEAECPHLVFGCPKNRNIPNGADSSVAKDFFRTLADFAEQHGVIIGIEANPVIYGTNFINTTQQAIDFVSEIDRENIRLNLDIGTMIANDEKAEVIKGVVSLISHVHISEPYLKPIQKRKIHLDILRILYNEGYQGYVSVEMGKNDECEKVQAVIGYIYKLSGMLEGDYEIS